MELPQWLRGKDVMQGALFYLWVEKIPWRRKWQPTPVFLPGKSQIEESGGLQSMGFQIVGHD